MSLAGDGSSPKTSKSLKQTQVNRFLLKGTSKRIRREATESVATDALPNADCVKKKETWTERSEESITNRPLANGFDSSLKVTDRSALQFHKIDLTTSLGEVINGNDTRGMFRGVDSAGSRTNRPIGSGDSPSSATSIANISLCNYALSNCV